MSHLLARLVSLADCDARAGEPLGKAMREAAAEIVRLEKHIAIMHDIADQRDTIIRERDAKLARPGKDAAFLISCIRYLEEASGDSLDPEDGRLVADIERAIVL
jgi:hypothetical protein